MAFVASLLPHFKNYNNLSNDEHREQRMSARTHTQRTNVHSCSSVCVQADESVLLWSCRRGIEATLLAATADAVLKHSSEASRSNTAQFKVYAECT